MFLTLMSAMYVKLFFLVCRIVCYTVKKGITSLCKAHKKSPAVVGRESGFLFNPYVES